MAGQRARPGRGVGGKGGPGNNPSLVWPPGSSAGWPRPISRQLTRTPPHSSPSSLIQPEIRLAGTGWGASQDSGSPGPGCPCPAPALDFRNHPPLCFPACTQGKGLERWLSLEGSAKFKFIADTLEMPVLQRDRAHPTSPFRTQLETADQLQAALSPSKCCSHHHPQGGASSSHSQWT